MRFKGFRTICEADFEKSDMDKVLARDFNIIPKNNDQKTDTFSAGGAIEFKGGRLQKLNKLFGINDAPDTAMKLIRVINQNDYGVQLEDITGACDQNLLNKGRETGRFADRPFPHAACSPTNGQKFWVSAKDWDNIRMPLPSNSAGGMGGMPPMGGPPPGGAGAPPPPPPPT